MNTAASPELSPSRSGGRGYGTYRRYPATKDEEPTIEELDDHTWLLSGLVTINDLNNELDIELESESHDTISGLLMVSLAIFRKKTICRQLSLTACALISNKSRTSESNRFLSPSFLPSLPTASATRKPVKNQFSTGKDSQ